MNAIFPWKMHKQFNSGDVLQSFMPRHINEFLFVSALTAGAITTAVTNG